MLRSNRASLLEQEIQVLTIPWRPRRLVVEKRVSGSQAGDNPAGIKNREALLTAIAKARVWAEGLVADRATISEIAKREGKGRDIFGYYCHSRSRHRL